MELGLERVSVVVARMGLKPPPFLTIAVSGTNGKGSTVAMLEAILHEAGYKIGAYSSPHMFEYNERIRVSKQPQSDEILCAAFERIEHIRGDTQLTYFEFGTLAALQVFSEQSVDVALLEVGLGGQLDAVNVLDADVAIVTCIGIDHVRWLGADREAIGREKAGIFRLGHPAICSDISPPAVIEQSAQAVGARLYQIGRDYQIEQDIHSWCWRSKDHIRSGLPYPAMRGEHQLHNAAGTLMALTVLAERLPVSQAQIRGGLLEAVLPGRFQTLPGLPVRVFDVAHNVEATVVLTTLLRRQPAAGRTFVVLGMLEDKPIADVMSTINPIVHHWYLSTLAVPRGATAETLHANLESIESAAPADLYRDPLSAYQAARKDASERDRIVVFGSFFTVSDILSDQP